MSRCAGGVRFVRRSRHSFKAPVAELPLFLCPGWIGISRAQLYHQQPRITSARSLPSTSTSSHLLQLAKFQTSKSFMVKLPPQCSGCGALSQVVDKDEAGYYNLKRRSVTEYLQGGPALRKSKEDAIVEKSLKAAADVDLEILKLGLPNGKIQPSRTIYLRKCSLN
jgi:genetic interactor of prohibitins 3, mitochondrial